MGLLIKECEIETPSCGHLICGLISDRFAVYHSNLLCHVGIS